MRKGRVVATDLAVLVYRGNFEDSTTVLAFFADVWVFGGNIELLCVVSSKRKGTKTVDV
jgi:hypothetical protein